MTRMLDNIGDVVPDDLGLSVALGQHRGWRAFRKFGMNDAVVVSTTQEMWPVGTAKTLPSAAGTVSVVSDDLNDDDTDTGAWTVTIQGLDANYDEIEETVTMDGTTPVVTTASFLRLNRAFVVTAGSSELNEGNISMSIGGNVQAYIEANQGQTHQTHYTVPAGHTLIVTYFTLRVGRMSGSTDLHVLSQIKLNGDDTAWRSISDVYLWDGGAHYNDASVTAIPEKTEIRQVINSTTTTQAVGVYGGYLVKNDYNSI